MRHLLILLLLGISVFASNLLNSKIYDRGDRVDLLLSFDTVYTGTVSRYERDGRTYLILANVNAPEDANYPFSTLFLKSINIYKSANRVLIEIAATGADIVISKVPPGYGLRVRITKALPKPPLAAANEEEAAIPVPQLGESVEDLSQKYAIVGIFVGVLLLLVLLIKIMASRKMVGGGKNGAKEARIIYSKPIDARNRLMLIEFNGRHHLVLMGAAGNVLIDSADSEMPVDNFNALLKSNSKSLDQYLSGRQNERIKEYKNKLDKK